MEGSPAEDDDTAHPFIRWMNEVKRAVEQAKKAQRQAPQE
jgi:hypothetical protein